MLNVLKNIINDHPTHVLLYVKKNNELCHWLIEHTPQLDSSYSILTRVYWVLNDITSFPLCENCKKPITKNIASLKNGYANRSGHVYCCHKCGVSSKTTLKLRQNTCIEKYGVDAYAKTQECKDKNAATCMKRHGVRNGGGSKQSLEKAKKTNLERRGVEYVWQSKEVKEKGRQTNMQNYGTPNNMQSEKGKQEYRDGMLNAYGYDHNWKIPEAIAKRVEKSYEKFGKHNYNNREKATQTWLDNYGVDHPSKCPEIRKKQAYNYYKYDGEKFNSSWEVAYWIWCKDHNIKIEHEPISLDYVDSEGTAHKYFPDFRLNGTQFVEIKGDDQFDKSTGKMVDKLDKSKNYIAEAKHQCMLDNNVQILLYEDCKPYIDYVEQKYGKGYLKQFKCEHKK